MSDGEFKGLNVKKTTLKKSSKGADLSIFNLDQETVHALIEKLTVLAEAPRGAKLTFSSSEKQGNYGPFVSTYFFVDEIQAPGEGFGGGQGGFQGRGQGGGFQKKGTFKPKQKGMSEATRSAAARTLRADPVE